DDISALLASLEPSIGPAEARQTLAEKFGVPPFSVLDARQGYWQERKRAWIALGIQSELGRGGNQLDMSATMAGITDARERDLERSKAFKSQGKLAASQRQVGSRQYHR